MSALWSALAARAAASGSAVAGYVLPPVRSGGVVISGGVAKSGAVARSGAGARSAGGRRSGIAASGLMFGFLGAASNERSGSSLR